MIVQQELVLVWLKSNWRWGALNLFAGYVCVYVLSQGSTGWSNMDTFDSGLESGKWAIRFLLTSLTMTPLNTYFGWKSGIKLRKPAGLWAFGFASLHILLYIREAKLEWLALSMPFYLALGLTGMIILSMLAATSNPWSMKWLGKNWKRLHRLVYFSGVAVVTHSMLATTISKKILGRDPHAIHELKMYVAVLAAVLFVRIPVVRQILRQIPALLKGHRRPGLKIGHVAIPDGESELWPRIQGRESTVSLKPTFIIPSEMRDPAGLNGSGGPFERTDGLFENREDRLPVDILAEEKGEVQEAVPD